MIDEKKLIEDLKDYANDKDSKEIYGKKLELILHDCIIEVENQPKIEIVEWIPCSERLPEESLESVIGWDEYSERCCFVQYWGGRWIFGNDTGSVKIVAWQPLPEPYKPKRRNLRNEQRKI